MQSALVDPSQWPRGEIPRVGHFDCRDQATFICDVDNVNESIDQGASVCCSANDARECKLCLPGVHLLMARQQPLLSSRTQLTRESRLQNLSHVRNQADVNIRPSAFQVRIHTWEGAIHLGLLVSPIIPFCTWPYPRTFPVAWASVFVSIWGDLG